MSGPTGTTKRKGRKVKNVVAESVKPGRLKLSIVEEDDPPCPETHGDSETSVHVDVSAPPEEIATKLPPDEQPVTSKLERHEATVDRPGFFEMLSDFDDVYPNRTDIWCWWCCHPFDSRPIGIPVKYDDAKDVFKGIGCFCSINCAYAHAKKERMKVHLSDFVFMYQKLTGNTLPDDWSLMPAPDRIVLQNFGGPLTIDEFRSAFENKFDVVMAPMMPFGMLCDEILGKRSTKAKDGRRRILEIRKAKKKSNDDKLVDKNVATATEKTKKVNSNHKTSVTQLVSFS